MKYIKKDRKEIERIVKDFLLKKDEIEFAYFFGSIVNSEAFHDIDIAVYLNKNFN
jgi:predicted nucleotidyltransferase